jgi:hypothetical protein
MLHSAHYGQEAHTLAYQLSAPLHQNKSVDDYFQNQKQASVKKAFESFRH